jgi:hypothetical protein
VLHNANASRGLDWICVAFTSCAWLKEGKIKLGKSSELWHRAILWVGTVLEKVLVSRIISVRVDATTARCYKHFAELRPCETCDMPMERVLAISANTFCVSGEAKWPPWSEMWCRSEIAKLLSNVMLSALSSTLNTKHSNMIIVLNSITLRALVHAVLQWKRTLHPHEYQKLQSPAVTISAAFAYMNYSILCT